MITYEKIFNYYNSIRITIQCILMSNSVIQFPIFLLYTKYYEKHFWDARLAQSVECVALDLGVEFESHVGCRNYKIKSLKKNKKSTSMELTWLKQDLAFKEFVLKKEIYSDNLIPKL